MTGKKKPVAVCNKTFKAQYLSVEACWQHYSGKIVRACGFSVCVCYRGNICALQSGNN